MCIIQIRLTKQIRRNKLKSKASSRGQGRHEFALYRRTRGYGRNTSCKRRLAVVGESACIIQIRLTKQIRRNKLKSKASSRGEVGRSSPFTDAPGEMGETQATIEGLQLLPLRGKLVPSEGKYLLQTSHLDVVAFAREVCSISSAVLAANIPPRCCCLCEE